MGLDVEMVYRMVVVVDMLAAKSSCKVVAITILVADGYHKA